MITEWGLNLLVWLAIIASALTPLILAVIFLFDVKTKNIW